MSWQPIETAPKDGTLVLLYAKIDEGPIVVAGWYEDAPCDRRWYDVYHGPFYATHWMPLPPPPEAA